MERTQITATELKQRLGRYLDDASQNPVIITRDGRVSAVLLSGERYEELQAIEDRFWAEKAMDAIRDGYLGTDESMRLIQRGLSEDG